MPISLEPIKPSIGAVVTVERDALRDDAVVSVIRDALDVHGVLVFPRLGLGDAEQLALTDRLGGRFDYGKAFPGNASGIGDVYKVGFDDAPDARKEFVQGTYFWHIDGVMVDLPVSKTTLLSARRLSKTGGQTEFANTYAAYDALPPAEKAELDGLRAIHNLAPSMRMITEQPTEEQLHEWRTAVHAERPIVWSRESGRKSLVIGYSADQIVGMPIPDGRALIARLIEWTAQPAFRYTHHWQEGDLVLWDNTGMMHRVRPYDERSGRTMHRTTIAGTEMAA